MIPVNIKDLTFFVMTDETVETYGTAISLSNRFETYTDTPAQQTASQYGDGSEQRSYVAKNGGQLALTVNYLTQDERSKIFGETVTGQVAAMGKSDIIPYLCVAFKTENADGTINLHKYPKIKLTEGATSVTQKGADGVQYSSIQLSGTYMFNGDGEARYVAEDLNTTTYAADITSWLTDGADHAVADETLKELTVTSIAGTESGDTAITVSPTLTNGYTYVYQTDTVVTPPALDDVLNGWLSWDGTSDITATTGDEIGIAEIDGSLKCKAYGEDEVLSKV